MKILINTPQLLNKGGVGSYYLSLRKYWSENVRYHTTGSRKITNINFRIPGAIFLPFDIIKFLIILFFWRPKVVVLNPSFAQNALVRDLIFLNIVKFCKQIKICVFFRGWDANYEKKVNKKALSRNLNKAHDIIVLSSEFRNKLISWGVKRPIKLSTTKVDDSLLNNFKIADKKFENKKILFLSKIKKEKGIYEALDTFIYFNKSKHNVEFNIVGNGPALEDVISYIKKKKIKNVNIHGHVTSDNLAKIFNDNDIFIFPSFHGEGMPNAVLEAMAFGLPVVTRSVGGLKDFFENEKMGYITNSNNPKDFFNLIEKLILNPNLIKEIGIYNHNFACKNFLASKVANKFETLLKNI